MKVFKGFLLGFFILFVTMSNSWAITSTGLSQKDLVAYNKIEHYILEAEQKTGESADLLSAVAYAESNFGRNKVNSHSSSRGVFQQNNQRWRTDLKKHAHALGLSAKSSVHNKRANVLLGAAGLADNRAYLERKFSQKITDGDVYMSWFVGLYGAERILKGKPNTKISKYVKLSKGNWSLYTQHGKVLTVAQFREKMNSKINRHKKQVTQVVNRSKFNALIAKLQRGNDENIYTTWLYR